MRFFFKEYPTTRIHVHYFKTICIEFSMLSTRNQIKGPFTKLYFGILCGRVQYSAHLLKKRKYSAAGPIIDCVMKQNKCMYFSTYLCTPSVSSPASLSLSKRLQWYDKEPHTYFMLECLLQWYNSTIPISCFMENMSFLEQKQKLFVKCLWMNWLIATNIYNVNKKCMWKYIHSGGKVMKCVRGGARAGVTYFHVDFLNL